MNDLEMRAFADELEKIAGSAWREALRYGVDAVGNPTRGLRAAAGALDPKLVKRLRGKQKSVLKMFTKPVSQLTAKEKATRLALARSIRGAKGAERKALQAKRSRNVRGLLDYDSEARRLTKGMKQRAASRGTQVYMPKDIELMKKEVAGFDSTKNVMDTVAGKISPLEARVRSDKNLMNKQVLKGVEMTGSHSGTFSRPLLPDVHGPVHEVQYAAVVPDTGLSTMFDPKTKRFRTGREAGTLAHEVSETEQPARRLWEISRDTPEGIQRTGTHGSPAPILEESSHLPFLHPTVQQKNRDIRVTGGVLNKGTGEPQIIQNVDPTFLYGLAPSKKGKRKIMKAWKNDPYFGSGDNILSETSRSPGVERVRSTHMMSDKEMEKFLRE